ncbi:mechanosensitive ion channel family protein [Undibacterium pigrum]|uniref:Small-conductance mechanosensitive channel n=1 Tax=Undibacterium pigrum TaxID=401470 RepID=A0A318JKS6_9BURK|nr:mechanosensitive ion channel family protein [Undibacterium pigrum]PXX47732.1 small-conductance mechanosensitive channel [Undibacterium pigrum]
MDFQSLINRNFLDIPFISWITACGVAVLAYFVMHTFIGFFKRRLTADSNPGTAHVTKLIPQILGSTSNITLIITSVLIGVAVLDLPARWSDRVNHLWFLAFGLQLALWINKTIKVLSKRYFNSMATDGAPASRVSHTIIVWALQFVLWVVFALAMLSNVGINVSAFIASLGIGGIAIALAVQNVLGDLFASLAIAVDKPFEVGDAININGISGTVEHVGLKTTRLRADSGEQIVIANADLLKNTIRNFKRMKDRRVQLLVKVASDTPPDVLEQVPPMLRKIVEEQPEVRFDRAHLKLFDRSSIEFEVIYFVLKPEYGLYMDKQQAVNLKIMRELLARDISFSDPVQKIKYLDVTGVETREVRRPQQIGQAKLSRQF